MVYFLPRFLVLQVTDQVETSEPSGGSGLSGGEIAGIVVGSVAGVALIAGGSYYGYSSKKKDSVENLTSSNKVNPATPEAQVCSLAISFLSKPCRNTRKRR